jgi:hypothetical protein
MKHSLLNQNQMRSNGIIVDDCPVRLSPGNSSTHSIYFPDEDIRIPLQLNGCMSHFVTRLPTKQEMNSCQWLVLTDDAEWDPYSSKFNENENDALSRSVGKIRTERILSSYDSNELRSISSVISLKATVEHAMISGVSTGVKLSVTAQELADNWGVSLSNAEQTLKCTTQHFIRSAVNPIEKRYQTAIQQLKYRQLGSELYRFYSDTMFASKRSVNQNACRQIFVNKAGFCYFDPMKREAEASDALLEFIQHVGIPSALHTDGSKTQTLGSWKALVKQHHIKTTETEPNSPWQNRAEAAIRELKRHVSRLMRKTNSPLSLWDYCCNLVARIKNLTANNYYAAHGRTPVEILTGDTPDISEYMSFQWYQPVWYLDGDSFPNDKKKLGRWVGISHRVGQAMCFWILTENVTIISKTTVQAVTRDELNTTVIHDKLYDLDQRIESKIGNSIPNINLPLPANKRYIFDQDDEECDEAYQKELEKEDMIIYLTLTMTNYCLHK